MFLIRESIAAAQLDTELHVVPDGEQAIGFFEQVDTDPSVLSPDLVILDLNLPKKTGREVLDQMRKTRRCAHALVLVVTSSNSERDRDEMANLGVSGYFRKPSEYGEFMKLGWLVKSLLEETPECRSPQ